jgi:hypothetical protein
MRDPQAGSLSAVPSFSPLVRCPAARPPHAPWRRHEGEGPDDMILAGGDGVVGWGLRTRPAHAVARMPPRNGTRRAGGRCSALLASRANFFYYYLNLKTKHPLGLGRLSLCVCCVPVYCVVCLWKTGTFLEKEISCRQDRESRRRCESPWHWATRPPLSFCHAWPTFV